jgi:hypothetical protein
LTVFISGAAIPQHQIILPSQMLFSTVCQNAIWFGIIPVQEINLITSDL